MTKTQVERSKFDRAVIPGTARNAITVRCDQFDAVQIVTDQVIRVIPSRAHVHRAAIDGFECYSAIGQRNLQIDLQRLAKCFTLQRYSKCPVTRNTLLGTVRGKHQLVNDQIGLTFHRHRIRLQLDDKLDAVVLRLVIAQSHGRPSPALSRILSGKFTGFQIEIGSDTAESGVFRCRKGIGFEWLTVFTYHLTEQIDVLFISH